MRLDGRMTGWCEVAGRSQKGVHELIGAKVECIEENSEMSFRTVQITELTYQLWPSHLNFDANQ